MSYYPCAVPSDLVNENHENAEKTDRVNFVQKVLGIVTA